MFLCLIFALLFNFFSLFFSFIDFTINNVLLNQLNTFYFKEISCINFTLKANFLHLNAKVDHCFFYLLFKNWKLFLIFYIFFYLQTCNIEKSKYLNFDQLSVFFLSFFLFCFYASHLQFKTNVSHRVAFIPMSPDLCLTQKIRNIL